MTILFPEINCGVPQVHDLALLTWNTSMINSSALYQCFDGSIVEVFCKEDGWDYPIDMCVLNTGKGNKLFDIADS